MIIHVVNRYSPWSWVATLTRPHTVTWSPGTHVPIRSEVNSQSIVRGTRPLSPSPLVKFSVIRHNVTLYRLGYMSASRGYPLYEYQKTTPLFYYAVGKECIVQGPSYILTNIPYHWGWWFLTESYPYQNTKQKLVTYCLGRFYQNSTKQLSRLE